MSKPDNTESENPGALPGLPAIPEDHPVAETISIPLPPRNPAPEHSAGRRSTAKPGPVRSVDSTDSGAHGKSRPDAPLPSRQRRKELAGSVVVAVAVNLLLVFAFLFIAAGGYPPVPETLFEVVPSRDRPEKDISDSAASPSRVQPEPAASGTASSAASIVTTTASQDLALTPSFGDSTALSRFETDPTLPSFGASLEGDALAAAKDEKRRQVEEFVNGNGGRGGRGKGLPGVGLATLEGLFPMEEMGGGDGMVLLTDCSGSMQSISRAVQDFVEERFPESKTYQVIGCALSHAHDPAIRQISRLSRRSSVSRIFFVCDLQDGEGARGIERLRRDLVDEDSPKQLHVISFDQTTGPLLGRLIEESGGSFRFVSPHFPPDDP